MSQFFSKKDKQKDFGRTMTEMLGVIAVMGALTIGGISGYKLAMNKYETNNLLDQLNKFSELCLNYYSEYPDFDCSGILSEMGLDKGNYQWRFTKGSTTKSFVLTIPNIPKTTCQNLAQTSWNKLSQINQDTPEGTLIQNSGTNCAQSNTLALTFTNPSLNDSTSGSDLGNTQTSDEKDPECPNNQILYEGECVDPSTCPTGNFKNEYAECIPCTDSSEYPSSKFHCSACPTRTWFNGGCRPTDCSPNTFFVRYEGGCQSCDSETPFSTTQDQCAKCGDKRYFSTSDSICYKKKTCTGETFDTPSGCKSCDDKSYYKVDKAACDMCGSKRFYNPRDGYCYKGNNCPVNQFDTSSGCFSCDSTLYASNTTEEECSKCGDKRWFHKGTCFKKNNCSSGQFESGRYKCQSCDDPNYYQTSEEQCAVCGDKRWYDVSACNKRNICGNNQFDTQQYECTGCDDSYPYESSKAECDKCGSKRWFDGYYCQKAKCSSSNYFETSEGCVSCDEPRTVGAVQSECNRCGDKRWFESGRCYPR